MLLLDIVSNELILLLAADRSLDNIWLCYRMNSAWLRSGAGRDYYFASTLISSIELGHIQVIG